jgi:DNA (cytosine-5)-methyltransferase 1
MRIGSLFSGIGGLELGLERAGLGRVAWQVEVDPFCRSVLAKHWPDAQQFKDVRAVSRPPPVEVICGGFPCQDLSSANVVDRSGLAGRKSGLWREFRRIVGEVGPRLVIVENVSSGWRDWVPVVRGDLGRLGYTSVPVRLSSADVGAPHDRDRTFIVAHADPQGQLLRALHAEVARVRPDAGRSGGAWRHPFTGPVRLDDGVSGGMDGTRAYGNSVVPACSEAVGRLIVDAIARSLLVAPDVAAVAK